MKKITTSLVLIILFVSCHKYENGPSFTLLTKKSRVVREWKISETRLNDEPISFNANLYNNSYSFEKNYDYIISGEANQNQPSEQKGSWEFTLDKSQLVIHLDGNSDTFQISKLKNNSMWLTREFQDGTLLYKYVPK